MGKSVVVFTPDASVRMNAILGGNKFFNGLANKCKSPETTIDRNLSRLNGYRVDIQTNGFNPTRQGDAKELYDKEMKGRTLKGIKQGLQDELERNLTKAADKAEQAIAHKWFELRITLQYDCLKFYTELFEDQAEQVAVIKAKEEAVAA